MLPTPDSFRMRTTGKSCCKSRCLGSQEHPYDMIQLYASGAYIAGANALKSRMPHATIVTASSSSEMGLSGVARLSEEVGCRDKRRHADTSCEALCSAGLTCHALVEQVTPLVAEAGSSPVDIDISCAQGLALTTLCACPHVLLRPVSWHLKAACYGLLSLTVFSVHSRPGLVAHFKKSQCPSTFTAAFLNIMHRCHIPGRWACAVLHGAFISSLPINIPTTLEGVKWLVKTFLGRHVSATKSNQHLEMIYRWCTPEGTSEVDSPGISLKIFKCDKQEHLSGLAHVLCPVWSAEGSLS